VYLARRGWEETDLPCSVDRESFPGLQIGKAHGPTSLEGILQLPAHSLFGNEFLEFPGFARLVIDRPSLLFSELGINPIHKIVNGRVHFTG